MSQQLLVFDSHQTRVGLIVSYVQGEHLFKIRIVTLMMNYSLVDSF